MLEFFTTNVPDPHHWTLISFLVRFFPFGCIWNRFSIHENRCKWANLVLLMQEFVPQSLVRIPQNRRTRSTQLDPELRFPCVSFRLGAFGTIMLLRKLDAKRAKLVQLMQKFVPRSLVRNFHNERSRSTTLESKLMFWCVSFCTKLAAKAPNWCN